MRRVLQALASIGLTAGPFSFPVLVLATMAVPPTAPAAEASIERVVVLLPQPSGEPEDPPLAPMEEPELPDQAPEERTEAPISSSTAPNFGLNHRKLAKRPRKTKKTKQKKPKSSRPCLPRDDRILKTAERQWTVERELVEVYGSPRKAEELAWSGWRRDESGQVEGFVLRRMRCGSLLRQAGLLNGDVVLAVDGKPVTNLAEGFQVWRKVRHKESIRVKVRRRDGKVEVLRYTLI